MPPVQFPRTPRGADPPPSDRNGQLGRHVPGVLWLLRGSRSILFSSSVEYVVLSKVAVIARCRYSVLSDQVDL